jgi:hypothetical protein
VERYDGGLVEYQFESQDQMWAEVQNMLDSPGWMGYIVPSLEHILKTDTSALSAQKRGETPDDFLRGEISLANKLLYLLPLKVQEIRDQRQKDSEKQGLIGPDGQPVGTGDPYGDNPGDGQPATA